MTKITNKILEESIHKVIKEYLDYNAAEIGADYDEIDPLDASDAEYDEMMDRYQREYPEEFEKAFGRPAEQLPIDPSTDVNGEDLPFEAKIRKAVRTALMEMVGENYPPGAQYDPRAPWNQKDPDTETETVSGIAYYVNPETEDEREIPFQVDVEVDGEYVEDWDEDGRCDYFQAFEDTDYQQLVIDSGELPEEIEGGYRLADIELD